MLPTKNEWKKWGSIERATYLAQLLSPFALLFTVVFSWLSWQATNESQIQQRDFFVALNAPKIDVSEVRIIPKPPSKRLLTFIIKNTGNSPAQNICIHISELLSDNVYRNTCDSDDRMSHMSLLSLGQGSEATLPLLKAEELEESLGYFPAKAFVYNFGMNSEKPVTVILRVFISYKGVTNDEHANMFTIAFTE